MKSRIVAKAIVMDDHGNCLLLSRSETHPDMAGQPDLPGGIADGNEPLIVTIAREIEEETGLTLQATNADLLFANTSAYNNTSVTRVLFALRVSGDKPEITLSWEHDDYKWVSFDELAAVMTHPIYKAGIEYIQQNRLLEKEHE